MIDRKGSIVEKTIKRRTRRTKRARKRMRGKVEAEDD